MSVLGRALDWFNQAFASRHQARWFWLCFVVAPFSLIVVIGGGERDGPVALIGLGALILSAPGYALAMRIAKRRIIHHQASLQGRPFHARPSSFTLSL